MANKSNIATQTISLPQGGGALHGIGETFSPDLHMGTGNFMELQMSKNNRQKTGKRLSKLAWFLDNSIPLPGINYRIGVDAIIGLIPGIGDAVGTLLSSYILGEAARFGVPKTILLKMGYNIAIESIVGIIPFFGDIFDMTWKANYRNVQLLETYMDNPHKTTSANRYFIAGLAVALVIFTVVISIVGFSVLRWIWLTVNG